MPQKIRQLIAILEKNGFVNRSGKGSHKNFLHPHYPFSVVISGKSGADAKPYQEKAVIKAIRGVSR